MNWKALLCYIDERTICLNGNCRDAKRDGSTARFRRRETIADFHFFIISDEPEKNNIAEYISRKNLKSNITMTVFKDNVTEILKSADIFQITSKTEGTGTAILDSFASNLPVIATNAGGIPGLVIDGKTGLLAMPEDSAILSKHIFELSKDALFRKIFTGAAGKHLQKFT